MALSNLTSMELYRGDYAVWDVDAGVDMTGATVYFAVYPKYPAGTVISDAGAAISKDTTDGIAFTDTSAGQFTITIETDDTKAWDLARDPERYVYGIEYQPSGETYRIVIGRGDFVLYNDVVRA